MSYKWQTPELDRIEACTRLLKRRYGSRMTRNQVAKETLYDSKDPAAEGNLLGWGLYSFLNDDGKWDCWVIAALVVLSDKYPKGPKGWDAKRAACLLEQVRDRWTRGEQLRERTI